MRRMAIIFLLGLCIFVRLSAEEDATGRREMQKGTTIAGACLFGTSWGTTLLAGALVASEASSRERGGIMTVGIPVAGPIVFSGKYGSFDDGLDALIWLGYLGMTAAQTTGIALFVRGIVGDKTGPERYSLLPYSRGEEWGLRLAVKF